MKTLILAFFTALFGLFSFNSKAQCDTLYIGNDTTLCIGDTLILDAGSGYTTYSWNDGSTGQFLTLYESGNFWCEVTAIDSSNLVQNGDFSSGNTSFYTDYIWGIGGPFGILSEEGTYVIDENAANTHTNFSPCVDHTTGNGLFMVVNGDTVLGENVWCQTVPVEPGTDYVFSGWFTSVHPANPAILSYFINGDVIETVYLSATTCNWENFEKQWSSSGNTEAEICIINQNTELGGNDFGIDDIHLLKICHLYDTISVSFEPAPQIDLGNDTLLCMDEGLELSAGGGFKNYLWSNGSSDSILQVTLPGYYWVEVTSENGCSGSDTIIIGYNEAVVLNLGSDTIICPGGTLQLDAGPEWMSYVWSTGSTEQTLVLNSPGQYWVMVEDGNGCFGSDTIEVFWSPPIPVDLGGDTTLCSGDSYVLTLGNSYLSYLWQDGSTGNSLQVTEPGTYWVQVTDNFGCSNGDTVNIGVHPTPEINLGSDTTICSGEMLVLDPGSQFNSYTWQDNSTLPFYTVTNSGYYNVTVVNVFNCSAFDEIFVEVTSPYIGLEEDTLLCTGDTIMLNATEGYESYIWQDGSTENYYAVTIGGTYSVSVTDENNCMSQATVAVDELQKPVADLGGDQTMCAGSGLILSTPEGPYSYFWNGVPGTNTMEVTTSGVYEVEVVNECGSQTSTSVITELPVPEINLGPDKVLEPGENLELDAGYGFEQYVWQDGSTGQFYLVSSEVQATTSEYWVEVWDGPCKNSDTINIEVFRVKVPNVITPNGDGFNDTFTPLTGFWSGITQHQMEIFNRWGEKVWASEDFLSGWDGRRDGKLVADGTYFWILTVNYGHQDRKKTLKGTVTVIQ